MHVFYAQGGGLGHLTRVDKLIKTLEIPKRDVIIITPSIFTHYFKGYWFVRLLWNEYHYDWTKKIEDVISKYEVTSFYVDTFPYGLKGELSLVYSTFPKLKYIYISRLLKWEKYLESIPHKSPINFYDTLLLEPLYTKHLDWIKAHSKHLKPFTLKRDLVSPVAFIDTPYAMVVHSGGKEDVIKICNLAIEDCKVMTTDIKIIVFTQVDAQFENANVVVIKNVYPVAQHFEDAQHIYTAGGFNSMQELRNFKHKHTALAFEKLYDDQNFRLENSKI